MFFINQLISNLSRILLKPFSVFILFLCAAYFLLISQWHYTQMSDFKNYYEESLGFLKDGKFNNQFLFFQAPGHPYLMSLIFRLTHSTDISLIQFLNAGIYIFCIILSHISFEVKPLWLKYIGTVSLSICVSYLSLMGFLAAEFHFLFFFVIGNFCLIKFLDTHKVKQTPLIVATALAFGIAQFIRPLSIYYLIFFGLGLLILTLWKGKAQIVLKQFNLVKYGAILILFLGIVMSLYRNITEKWTYQPTQNGLWSLFVGFNAKAKGAYNAEDITAFRKIAEPLNWEGDTLRTILKPQLIERVKENWQKNLHQVPQRAIRLLFPYHVSFWFFIKSTAPKTSWNSWIKAIFHLSTILILISYFSNFLYFLKLFIKSNLKTTEVFVFCALLSTYLYLIIHVFCLEIQPRYTAHLAFLNLWIFPLSLAHFMSFRHKD